MIEVKNLTKYYGDVKAVDDISFSIKKGEIVGILGPNGAGKSTTIRVLCCYLSPTKGNVHVATHSVAEEPRLVKNFIGYLAESAPLYADMMVWDYLQYVLLMRYYPREKIRAQIEKIADTCGLESVMHKSINELSKGYKQRVGLAHALLGDPEILILDEPTSGLDPNQIIEIRNLIKKIGQDKTVLLSSHILSEVEATCDRVIILNEGKIVADGKTGELSATLGAGQNIVIEFTDAATADLKPLFRAMPGIRHIEQLPQTEKAPISYALTCETGKDYRLDIYNKIVSEQLPLIGLYARTETLEGIFRELTASEEILKNPNKT
ncbi:ABC transporter ATP-binding protein [Spirochaetota bacterium]|nr:ABC transporter ATP-binding protein [Spirochaetota bacterium]